MFLIKICPSCNKKIRFPIDQGLIKVKCSCGYSFLADPDDKGLYENAVFDLKPRRGKRQKTSGKKELIPGLIEKIFDIKYKVQNFRLLTNSEKIKIILFFIFTLFIVVILLYLSLKNTGNIEDNKIII